MIGDLRGKSCYRPHSAPVQPVTTDHHFSLSIWLAGPPGYAATAP